MRNRFAICLCLLLVLPFWVSAQGICGFDELHRKRMKEDPVYRDNVEQQQQWIQQYIREHPQELMPDQPQAALYTIPVVVHVVHTGGAVGTIYNPADVDITGAIDYLNQVYAGTWPGTEGVGDLQIQFALALRDPNCNTTTGIERIDGSGIANYTAEGVNVNNSTGVNELVIKNLSRWNTVNYYNIWVVDRIDGKDGTSGSFVAGFAYFPGSPANYDGTIMLATQMKPNRKTLPHEIGHAFSLYHPFQSPDITGATCPPNADCTVDGDKVCDTDPITIPSAFVCRSGNNSCTGTPYDINTEHNYMNYTNCATLFTAGQKARMLAAAAGPFRNRLMGSYALSPMYPLIPYTNPASASCSPVTSSTGLGGDFAGVIKYSLASRVDSSGTARSDGGYRNNTGNCHLLAQLQRGGTYTLNVTLLGVNGEQLKGWIDYDNNGVFNNATETVISFSESAVPGPRPNVTASASFTVPATAVINTNLRLRLIEDLSVIYGPPAISGGCTDPVYGQAEDYPIFILPSGALPVNFISFSGQRSGDLVSLSWETSSEQGADRYIIQRSPDGVSYSDIGERRAVGNSGQVTNYAYNDRPGTAGSYYYRLKQVDADGRYDYSKTILVIMDERSGKARILNNPAGSYLDIQLSPDAGQTSLRITDITGKTLLQKKLPVGLQRYRIDEINQLIPGVYILELAGNHDVEVIRFIKN